MLTKGQSSVRVAGMAKATVIGSVVEMRGGTSRATLTIEGMDGWKVTVTTRQGATGQHITELRVAATRPDLVLTGEQLRKVTPADLIRAMVGPRVPSTAPADAFWRTNHAATIGIDSYLIDLVTTALERQGTVRSVRRALAEQFNRSETQIRDDLHKARAEGYLMPSSGGTRLLQAGPRYTDPTNP